MASSDLNNDGTRFFLRRLIVAVAAVSLFLAAASFAVRTYNSIFKSFDKFTAIWLTHDMLVAHINKNNGDWPTGWNDLEPHFASINP